MLDEGLHAFWSEGNESELHAHFESSCFTKSNEIHNGAVNAFLMGVMMTAQIHEILILNGKKTSMAFCPPIPRDQRVIEYKEDEIEHDGMIFSTACWRQYVGTWEIKNDRFYLVNLTGRFKLVESSPVLADWFTGVLRIPQGERLHYVHMGFGSVYENELHIKIDHGVVVKSVTIDNRNKDFDELNIGFGNLPGFENNFDGDDI